MVGLALVVLVTVFAAGIRGSVTKAIDDQVTAALIVQNQDGFSPIPQQAADTVAKVDGVTDVSPCASRPASFDGSEPGRDRHRARDGQLRAQAQVGPGRRGHARRADGRAGPARRPTGRSPTTSTWAGRSSSRPPPARRRPTQVAGTFKNQAGLTAPIILTRGHAGVPVGLQEPRVRDGGRRRGRRPRTSWPPRPTPR